MFRLDPSGVPFVDSLGSVESVPQQNEAIGSDVKLALTLPWPAAAVVPDVAVRAGTARLCLTRENANLAFDNQIGV